MYFGADYYPGHWVFPYDGSAEQPEARWEEDARLMAAAGMNVVRMGEYSWGLCEANEGQFDFAWLRRAMDILGRHGLKIVLGTPTAAPPLWLTRKHPEVLPMDEHGLRHREGTRHAYCLNSDIYWDYCRKVVSAMAAALGNHPDLIAWQVDDKVGRGSTEYSFNPETRRDWQAWLKSKYGTIEELNTGLGTTFRGQQVTAWNEIPMPMAAPDAHNPALLLDWRRFASDTCVAFVRMQVDILHGLCPTLPVTTNLRPFAAHFDYSDLADGLDFVALDTDEDAKNRPAERACLIDFARSLKKGGQRTPDGDEGFWAMEQKVGRINWGEASSLFRPGVVRLLCYQLISRGASGLLCQYWRPPRIGTDQFDGGVLPHSGITTQRMYKEIRQLGTELARLAPLLAGSKVVADACILHSQPSEWAADQSRRPNPRFHPREVMGYFYHALHGRNILVDFARPSEDLSGYKLVIVPALQLLSGAEVDALKLYVHNGGILIATCHTGLVDEYHIAPTTGLPYDMTDLFGMEVVEWDAIPPSDDNQLAVRTALPTTGSHPARLWCDLIEVATAQVLATYGRDFYAGTAVITMNDFGAGKAIYLGTVSHQMFYNDLIVWARTVAKIAPHFRVPDTIELCIRHKDGQRLIFLLNHGALSVRLQFFHPVHDHLTDAKLSGAYDLPAQGVLVLTELAQ